MNQDFINHARLAIKAGRRCAFATVVESTVKGTPRKAGAKMIVFEDGSTHGTIGGGRNEKDVIARCLEAIGKSETRLMTYDYFGRKGESVCGDKSGYLSNRSSKYENLSSSGPGISPCRFRSSLRAWTIT